MKLTETETLALLPSTIAIHAAASSVVGRLPSDASRRLLNRAFGRALTLIGQTAEHSADAVVTMNTKFNTLRALNDKAPAEATRHAILAMIDGLAPMDVANHMASAILDPHQYAEPNTKARNGFGFAHPKGWNGSATGAIDSKIQSSFDLTRQAVFSTINHRIIYTASYAEHSFDKDATKTVPRPDFIDIVGRQLANCKDKDANLAHLQALQATLGRHNRLEMDDVYRKFENHSGLRVAFNSNGAPIDLSPQRLNPGTTNTTTTTQNTGAQNTMAASNTVKPVNIPAWSVIAYSAALVAHRKISGDPAGQPDTDAVKYAANLMIEQSEALFDHDFDPEHTEAVVEIATTYIPDDVDGIQDEEVINKIATLTKALLEEMGDADVATTTKPSAANAATAAYIKPISIDPAMAPGLGLMLNQATNGEITSADELSKRINSMAQLLADKDNQIKIAQAQAKQAAISSIPSGGKTTVNAQTLTYDVEMREAWRVVNVPQAKRPLGFEVPCLDWKDDQGNSVRHPQCPDIDEDYVFQPDMLVKSFWSIKRGHNVYVTGHYGTGKTTFIEQLAARMGVPVYRLNLDGYIERSEIIGRVDLVTDTNGATITRFNPGILPTVMPEPCWIVFDEFDAAKPDALFSVQRALEKNGLLLMEDGGRIIKPHPLFRFWATANSKGHGDEFGIYPNVNVMSGATMDRFDTMLEVSYLKPDAEFTMLKSRFPVMADDRIKQLVAFGNYVRDSFRNGELSLTVSPRGLHSYCQNYLDFASTSKAQVAHTLAMEVAFLDKSPADTRSRMEELAARAFK